MNTGRIIVTKEIVLEWFTEGRGTVKATCQVGVPPGAVLIGASLNDFGDLLLDFDYPGPNVIMPVFT
jgi:hypothetical protein